MKLEKKKKVRNWIIMGLSWVILSSLTHYFYTEYWPYEIKSKQNFTKSISQKNVFGAFLSDKKIRSKRFEYSSSGLFYESFAVEMTVSDGSMANTVRGALSQKRWGKNKNVVIILPTAGKNDTAPFMGWYMRNIPLPFWGYDTLEVRWEREFLSQSNIENAKSLDDIEKELKKLGRAMKLRRANYIHLIRWLKKEAGYGKVGLIGVSFGAIEGGFVSADENLDASVLIVGGADIADIFLNSEEPFFKQWKDRLLEKCKEVSSGGDFSSEQLTLMARRIFSDVDSTSYARFADPNRNLLMVGRDDITVPFKNGIWLWLIMNQPRLRIFPATHRVIIGWYTPLVFWQSGSFLKEKFKDSQ